MVENDNSVRTGEPFHQVNALGVIHPFNFLLAVKRLDTRLRAEELEAGSV